MTNNLRERILAMPDPVDPETTAVFLRWVDHTIPGAAYADDVLDDPTCGQDAVTRAISDLSDHGYTVARRPGTLTVDSPIPLDAPRSFDELVELIDPSRARRVVASLLTAYCSNVDGWSGGDAVELVGNLVPRAITDPARLPSLHEESKAAADYWKGLE